MLHLKISKQYKYRGVIFLGKCVFWSFPVEVWEMIVDFTLDIHEIQNLIHRLFGQNICGFTVDFMKLPYIKFGPIIK